MTEDTVLHEEKAPFSLTLKWSLYLILLLLFVLTLRSWLDVSGGREGFWILLIVTLFIVLVFQSFFNMRYSITTEGVTAFMWPFSFSVRFEDIEDIYLAKPSFWVGWGMRMWWGRNIGYISMHKVSVVIKKKKGFHRNFWLSTLDSEGFRGMIEERMESQK
ncbi:MAG: hypothetical protein ACE5J5_07015 [Candidatus Hydrothermarchaeales archaeon]